MFEILQISLKALSSEFTVVKYAQSKFVTESSELKLNSDSSDEKEMIFKQNLDILVPKYTEMVSSWAYTESWLRFYNVWLLGRCQQPLPWTH